MLYILERPFLVSGRAVGMEHRVGEDWTNGAKQEQEKACDAEQFFFTLHDLFSNLTHVSISHLFHFLFIH